MFSISGCKAQPTGDRAEEGTQLVRRLSWGSNPGLAVRVQNCVFQPNTSFLLSRVFRSRPISKHPEVFRLTLSRHSE